jgi:environmental stress-induced protein Ves
MISTVNWQVIQLQSVAPTPWRNGGGTTRELLAWPDSVDWQWRASVAEVATSGPFSNFAGVQRSFAVLDGAGVCLRISGAPHVLDSDSAPFAFDGAAPATCDLLGGPTQDFNLMVRGANPACMWRVKNSGTSSITIGVQKITNTPKIIAAYAHELGAKVGFGTENHDLPPFSFGWAVVNANVAVCVQASDALLMEIGL